MSQADVAAAMTAHGVPWKRATVVSIEQRGSGSRGSAAGRDRITVGELLALALVFDVPPIMLIADPRHSSDVPVAEGLTVSAWEALLWLTGSGTIDKAERDNFAGAAWLIQAGWTVVESLADLRRRDRVFDADDPVQIEKARQRDDVRHRRALSDLGTAVARITAAGAPLPPIIPVDVVNKRALELDVDLPDELREG